jgi:hypothetical protein
LHSLAVYANDTVGNMGATENVNFTIEKPEVFPIALVAAISVVAVALMAAGLLVHYKKQQQTQIKNQFHFQQPEN